MSRGAYIYHPSHSYLGEHETLIRNIPTLFVSVTHAFGAAVILAPILKIYNVCNERRDSNFGNTELGVGGVSVHLFAVVSLEFHHSIEARAL